MKNQTPTPSPADILIVDDTPANLRMLFQMLSEQGYRVRPTTSGKQALEAAHAAVPDLILLDIMMPEMNGYEVCGRLKRDEWTRDVPVIFISALDETQDKVAAFSIGAVDYIPKPFQVEEVLARVKTHLTLRSLQKMLEQKNEQLQTKNGELEAALAKVKLLTGMLPICGNCKKIRDDEGYWQSVEVYIRDHSEAEFSHSVCPDCMQTLYSDLSQKLEQRRHDILAALAKLGQGSLEDIALAVNLPAGNTLNSLQMMVKDKQVEQIELNNRQFYRLI